MSNNPFFVSGITGHVGGAAARRLLEDGHAVRTLARDPSKATAWLQRGVDVRQGDLSDAASVAAALEGVSGAFLMIPPMLAPSPGFPEAPGRPLPPESSRRQKKRKTQVKVTRQVTVHLRHMPRGIHSIGT